LGDKISSYIIVLGVKAGYILLARGGSALGFLGPEPVLGVSRWIIRTKLNQWLTNQHWASWRDLEHTQRQARELISGPYPGFKAKFLSFNRTQSRVVTGLLTVHNTLRRHFYLLRQVPVQGVWNERGNLSPHSL